MEQAINALAKAISEQQDKFLTAHNLSNKECAHKYGMQELKKLEGLEEAFEILTGMNYTDWLIRKYS